MSLPQMGNGFEVYRGAPYQRGYGVGSVLGGLFRAAVPLLKKGALAVGKEMMRSGINVMEDVGNEKPFKESVKERLKQGKNNLKRAATDKFFALLKGDGYKPKKKRRKNHSSPSSRKSGHASKRQKRVPKKTAKGKKRKLKVNNKNKKKKGKTDRGKKSGRRAGGKQKRKREKREIVLKDIFGNINKNSW